VQLYNNVLIQFVQIQKQMASVHTAFIHSMQHFMSTQYQILFIFYAYRITNNNFALKYLVVHFTRHRAYIFSILFLVTSYGLFVMTIWSFACLIAPAVTTTTVNSSSYKIQNRDILVLANPGPP